MTVKHEASGRRSVQIDLDVPGTPEEVWNAIATGPGISSWAVPTEFEERDGLPVAMKMRFGPGMEARGTLTAWEPPRRWAGEAEPWAPGAPPMASEWTVEARSGGTCVIHIVHSLFADTDEWDEHLEGATSGWSGFLRTLQLHLTHFRGRHATLKQWLVPAAVSEAEAWETLTAALGAKGLSVGQRCTAPAGVPAFSGVVAYVSRYPNDMLLLLDQPGPGIAALGTFDCGQTMVGMNFYLHGDRAAETIARETPRWEAWFSALFPVPAHAG